MFVVFGRVASIFILILIGFIANKIGVLPDTSRKHLTNLMLCITAPCMAAQSLYSKELSEEVITDTIQILVGTAVYFIIVTALAFVMVKGLKFKPKKEWGIYIVAITCINTGFMGFPITKAIFGDDLFYLMVIENIILCVYLYSLSPILLYVGRDDKPKGGLAIMKSILNPCTIGIIVGVVMLILGIKPPQALDEVVTSLSEATIPLSMIIVGVQLGSSNIREMIKNKYINITNVVTMVFIPIVTFLIVDQFDFLSSDVKVILIFASVFPTAVAPSAIAEKEGLDPTRLAELVSVTTVTSLIVIPIAAAFLTGYYY